MDKSNLVYNGDLSRQLDGWSGSDLVYDSTQNCLTLTGNLINKYLIPTSSSDTYKLTFDIKFNTKDSNSFYTALIPCDSDNKFIEVASIYRRSYGDVKTTLAKDLISGDTTATLVDGSLFPSNETYQCLGICDNIAWGYKRCSQYLQYTSRNANILTLKSTYSGKTIPAGTNVGVFFFGPMYFYPWSNNSSNLPTEWSTYSTTFKGGDSMRYSCQYFKFSTLGYLHNYSIRNIRIENLTQTQICEQSDVDAKVNKTGIVHFNDTRTRGRRIRYVKDSINGSTANSANHWVEIQTYNQVDENIAFNKPVNLYYNNNGSFSTGYRRGILTDGLNSTSPYDGGYGGEGHIILDLGFIEHVNSIKVWHYWGDHRTYYDHKMYVSEDGVNWDLVYSGQQQETANGIEVLLYPKEYSIQNNGNVYASSILET